MQGAGWLTLEDLRWDKSRRPDPRPAHHPVGVHLQAAELLGDARRVQRRACSSTRHEDGAVYGSKAVGEPPLMLAFSVREALREAAAASGRAGVAVDLASPATPEAVYWALAAAARRAASRAPAVPTAADPTHARVRTGRAR